MTARTAADAAAHTAALTAYGLRPHPDGQVTLSGDLLDLLTELGDAVDLFAALSGAERRRHPALIAAADLAPVDYLGSFPHLATFAVCLADKDDNLREFTAGPALDGTGTVRLTRTAPVRQILTPAACYHLYPELRGTRLNGPHRFSVGNTCFRREAEYAPLRRQWSFQMRELVCVGSRDEVTGFLGAARAAVSGLLSALDIPVEWQVATDPFFRPAENPKALAQRLRPTKHEAVYGGDLAIASVNLHEDHFGAAYGITRDGRPATSGCVAFGLERWLYAITHHHGPDPAGWPDPVTAAAGMEVR